MVPQSGRYLLTRSDGLPDADADDADTVGHEPIVNVMSSRQDGTASKYDDGNVGASRFDCGVNRMDWEKIAPIVLSKRGSANPETQYRKRKFVGAVLWVARNYGLWEMLPSHYGKNHSVYVTFTRWVRRGVWRLVIEALGTSPNASVLLWLVTDYEIGIERRRRLTEFRRRVNAGSGASNG